MTKRSSGDRAVDSKLAMGGQRELTRAADQAEHTKKYPPADYPHKPNPFRREVFYSGAELGRLDAFRQWKREHPDAANSDNPHRYEDRS